VAARIGEFHMQFLFLFLLRSSICHLSQIILKRERFYRRDLKASTWLQAAVTEY
jgi:hypothetical protein